MYADLAEECGLDESTIETTVERVGLKNQKKYLIKEGLDYEKALILIEKLQSFPGIYLEKRLGGNMKKEKLSHLF